MNKVYALELNDESSCTWGIYSSIEKAAEEKNKSSLWDYYVTEYTLNEANQPKHIYLTPSYVCTEKIRSGRYKKIPNNFKFKGTLEDYKIKLEENGYKLAHIGDREIRLERKDTQDYYWCSFRGTGWYYLEST